mgnify:CR=1 FL=1
MIVYSNFPLLYVCGAQNAAHRLFDCSAKLQSDGRCDPPIPPLRQKLRFG